MKLPWPLKMALCATCVATAFAQPARAPKLPLEDFAHQLAISHALISPDGVAVAYQAVYEKDASIAFLNLDTRKTVATEIAYDETPLRYGLNQYFVWIGANRAIYSARPRNLGAIDYDGLHYRDIPGGRVVHAFTGKREGETLQEHYDQPVGLYGGQFYAVLFPDVLEVDSRAKMPSVLQGPWMPTGFNLKNPGNVVRWIADSAGVIRVGVQTVPGRFSIIYRENEKAGWHVPKGLNYDDPPAEALGLSGDGQTLYIARVTPQKHWGVYAYNLATESLGDLILSHNHYDIVPPADSIPTASRIFHDGASMQSLVFSRVQQELLGIRYYTTQPQTLWLDPTLRSIQAAVDQALPKRINTITSFSDDLTRTVILSWTARDPGTYYTFDLNKKSLAQIFSRMPWIKPAQMAPVYPVSYKAHDGLVIDGYLTVPLGCEPKNLPLIVNPHGGPWDRNSLHFDALAQFLANRGYAVLQVNYRGSTGYGEDFYRAGHRELGHKMQDDITDGTQWAIAKGIADPARIGILGSDFGGYSSLMGLARSPNLYCCGVAIDGVTDWVAFLENDHGLEPENRGFYRDEIGDRLADQAELNAISPLYLADKIHTPLLLVQGKDDPYNPYSNMTKYVSALKAAHAPYELMPLQNEMHGIKDYQDIVAVYSRIEQFLAKNMPADPGPTVAAH